MGQEASTQSDVTITTSPHDFANQVAEACKNEDLQLFRQLWQPFVENEKRREKKYYTDLLADNIMDHIKNAFRHKDLAWREAGILVSRTFFHIPEARKKLVRADFVGSVLLITLPEASPNQEEAQELTLIELTEQQNKQEELQLLAAKTFSEMAHHPDFLSSLCATSVLNFLCIVLNQVPKSQDIVTQTFVKLSDDKRNLIVLMEGAMGDILETFFKTVAFKKEEFNLEDKVALQQWRTGTIALSNTAQALAMLIKYNHPCQVDMPTIIKVFSYSLAVSNKDNEPQTDVTAFPHKPDNVQLLAEMAQLLYWKCCTTHNTTELLVSSTPRELGLDDESGLDFVLTVVVAMWKRCTETQAMLDDVAAGKDKIDPKVASAFEKFCVDDLDRTVPLTSDSPEFEEKKRYAQMRLCYLNCTLWVLLPMSNLRWKLRNFGLEQLHLAFNLRDEAYLLVILGTVRYLVDFPAAQESTEFVKFFGEQLLILLDLVLSAQITSEKCIFVLLDAISILAMARDMQEMLAKFNIHTKLLALSELARKWGDEGSAAKVELAVLRSLAEVAIHPSHRLNWVDKKEQADEAFKIFLRDDFQGLLQSKLQSGSDDAGNDNLKTISSLLLTILRDEKFKRPAADIESMFTSVSGWWLGNSTARFDEGKSVGQDGNQGVVKRPTIDLQELLQTAQWRIDQNQAITVRESEKIKCPHECVIVLSLFSRLALEPKFKLLFVKHDILDALLGCVCVGIWAEAREAAATIANLMWLPDLKEEGIVCWLKFDGPRCVTVDAANVLMPVKHGNPKPVDIGKGMYKSSWGIEFVEGAVVMLHPRGLQTHRVPGMLTTASPLDTFKNVSQKPYEWFEDQPADAERWFSITCWFYWQPTNSEERKQRVLVHTTPSEDGQDPGKPAIFVEISGKNAVWMLNAKEVGQDGTVGAWKPGSITLETPDINPGWHMVSVVSSTVNNPEHPFNGTKFYIDDWSCVKEGTWIPNDFYTVGNSPCHKKPFGLITDFRIYSRVLKDNDLKSMVREPAHQEFHPDQLTRKLAARDAASILALRLDVPDSAAECLRALGSLASLASERAKIFSLCGRRVLQLIDSPLPMIQRQAARLINNIT